MYNEKVKDHFMNPRNAGDLPDADGTAVKGDTDCGDVIRISIKVSGNRIIDAKFKTFGCGAAIAVSSMITEMAKGKTLDEAFAISNEDVAKELGGLPPQKMHCSNMGADVLKKAIEHYKNKKEG